MVSTQRSSNHHSLPAGMYTGEELHDMDEKITPTDYEALRFVLLAPFSLEGGNEATYSADEIDTALDYASKIKASLDAAERRAEDATTRWIVATQRIVAAERERDELREALEAMAERYARHEGEWGGTGIANELRKIMRDATEPTDG